MEERGGKITGIGHIVRLKEMVHKWQEYKKIPNVSELSAGIDQRLKMACSACDSDEESFRGSSDPPPDVPKGYLAVYAGPEHRRFVIPTAYLGLPVFKVLLEKAEEEFGFEHEGAITFPCEIETFKYILQCMEKHQKGLIDDEGNPTNVEE